MRTTSSIILAVLVVLASATWVASADHGQPPEGTVVVAGNQVDWTIAHMVVARHDFEGPVPVSSGPNHMMDLAHRYECIVQIGPVDSGYEPDDDQIVRLIGATRYQTNDLALRAALDETFGCTGEDS